MLELLLNLDAMGIVPCGSYSVGEYVKRGTAMLRGALLLKAEYPLGQQARVFGSAEGYNAKRVVMPREAANEMKEKFRTDISWLPVFEAECGFRSHTAGEATDLYRDGQRIPALIYCEGTKQTLLHEAIHAVRSFADYVNNKAFEEAAADDGRFTLQGFSDIIARWKNALIVRAARKNLEGCIGPNAGYALLRLTKPEMMAINRGANTLGYLKELGCLRHKIIKERLGI